MTLPIAAAGAIAGPVLYWTRAWRRRDHVRALLGWTVAGAVAGAILGGSGAIEPPASITATAVGAFVGAFLFTMSRYCWWAYLNSGEDDTRSAGERSGQLIVLSLVSLPILLMVLLAAA
ncbi:MAG: hypothetical protein K8S21_10305 [Gemmatimonadetes bacterium]|nr:hypothetical protein [Gemmatimonadota bacterium]